MEITQEEKIVKPINEMNEIEILEEIDRVDYYIESAKERGYELKEVDLIKKKNELIEYLNKNFRNENKAKSKCGKSSKQHQTKGDNATSK